MDETGLVERFVEKPKAFVGDKINAGIYVLSTSVLNRIELRPTSIEQEVFPFIAQDSKLYAMTLQGYWMDIGQPKDYLIGLQLHLASLQRSGDTSLATGNKVKGNVLIDPSVSLGEKCLIGPDVCIGKDCVIGEGVRLRNCVIMSGTKIKDYAQVMRPLLTEASSKRARGMQLRHTNGAPYCAKRPLLCASVAEASLLSSPSREPQVLGSIIGWQSSIGRWARIENGSVVGEDVHFKDEIYVNGGIVLPHKEIKENVNTPQIIM
jgi:mannose-1-phosphate guanylyltransferase